MKVLTKEDISQLNTLIAIETENINRGFLISIELGKVFLSNAIESFVSIYLKGRYGEIVPQYSSEYRHFIVGILKNINDCYISIAFSEVLVPTVKGIGDDELLNQLSKLKIKND